MDLLPKPRQVEEKRDFMSWVGTVLLQSIA